MAISTVAVADVLFVVMDTDEALGKVLAFMPITAVLVLVIEKASVVPVTE